MVTSKHSQVLQNRHFAENLWEGVDQKIIPSKVFVESFLLAWKNEMSGII